MRTAILLFIAFMLLAAPAAHAQHVFADSSIALNRIRIKTNSMGMKVLGSWGVANIVVGGAGYFTENSSSQYKYFQGMNAIWGIINTGIAGMGLAGTRKEMAAQTNCADRLKRYEATKRLFVYNAGLDLAYIGIGACLTQHADVVTAHEEVWRGFGKSFIMQGAFLLVFDNVMFAMHQKQNKKWYRLLNGVCVTGNGIGYRYTIQ
jgi:hypothetical protein